MAIEILVDRFLVTVYHSFYEQEQHWLSSTHWENDPSQGIFYKSLGEALL